MDDEAEVLQTFDAVYAAACEARDPDALVTLFVDDDDLSWWGSGGSEQYLGPDGLRTFAEMITHVDAEIRFKWHERRVRIEGDVAWINALGEAEVVSATEHQRVNYRTTALMLKRDSRWLWHTYHGSIPADE